MLMQYWFASVCRCMMSKLVSVRKRPTLPPSLPACLPPSPLVAFLIDWSMKYHPKDCIWIYAIIIKYVETHIQCKYYLHIFMIYVHTIFGGYLSWLWTLFFYFWIMGVNYILLCTYDKPLFNTQSFKPVSRREATSKNNPYAFVRHGS